MTLTEMQLKICRFYGPLAKKVADPCISEYIFGIKSSFGEIKEACGCL